jgi:hypothetical protein
MAPLLGLAAKAVLLVLAPVLLSVALYSPKDFSPAAVPPDYSFGADVYAPRHDARVLASSERIGEGRLPGPEDLAYDAAGEWLYTGCADGWIRRVSVPGGEVEDWVYTGGRPLGVVLAGDGGLVVADADKVRKSTPRSPRCCLFHYYRFRFFHFLSKEDQKRVGVYTFLHFLSMGCSCMN